MLIDDIPYRGRVVKHMSIKDTYWGKINYALTREGDPKDIAILMTQEIMWE